MKRKPNVSKKLTRKTTRRELYLIILRHTYLAPNGFASLLIHKLVGGRRILMKFCIVTTLLATPVSD